MPTFPLQATAASPSDATGASQSMVVCGDGALAHRLAAELRELYGETVTLVVPGTSVDPEQPVSARALASASILLGRIVAAATRATGTGSNGGSGTGSGGSGDQGPAGRATSTGRGTTGGRATAGRAGAAAAERGQQDQGAQAALRVVEAPELTETELARAGVQDAAAVALVHDDDETNIRAALAARRLNPTVRLVIRLYNRRLGQYLQTMLDQAATLATPGSGTDVSDASTTVLSDADTAAPALAATAIGGRSKYVRAGGLLLNAATIRPDRGHSADHELCTLALLSSTADNPAGAEGTEASGADGPLLLPDEATVATQPSRRRVILTSLRYSGPTPSRRRSIRLGSLLSKRLRWSFAGLVSAVLALAVTSMLITGDHPVHAIYLTVLDLLAINDPAVNDGSARQILQLLSGIAGLLLLPVLLAAVLEALGSFRSGTVTRRPPRGLSGHVVLLGLGKIGTRVLVELRQLNIPVVCVEADPDARGVAVARRLRVPVVLGDVTQEGVLESAKIHRAGSLLALTSLDTINLEAALIARSVKPELRTVLRLYDDDFATAVFRTLRAAHPHALTRSRSVSYLAAPSFAAAMMGRQVLGAVPVERLVLLFAVVNVAGHPQLEGRRIADASRPGKWRILALDQNGDGDLAGRPATLTGLTLRPDRRGFRNRGTGATPDLAWDLAPGRVLTSDDRVVLAATRQGLAELLGRRPRRPTTG